MKKNYLIIIIFLILITGCSKKTIIGKWKSTDTKKEYYYIFNEDKTCSYEMPAARLDCTYEIDNNQIKILYKGNDKPNTFEYQLKDESLIIKDESNNYNEFTKEKPKK